jgi:hypothetical protein
MTKTHRAQHARADLEENTHMRRALPVALLAGLTVTACSSSTPPDPKTEWIGAVKAAGFSVNAPHTYDEMFESSKAFCGTGSGLAIAGLARTVLSPEMADTTAMPARGANPDVAAKAYGDATWKWACGR